MFGDNPSQDRIEVLSIPIGSSPSMAQPFAGTYPAITDSPTDHCAPSRMTRR